MSSKKHTSRVLKGLRSHCVTPEVTSEAVLKILESLNCPRSLAVAMLFKYKEHEQLAGLTCNPLSYNSMTEFRDAYTATCLLSKFKKLSLNYDVKRVALEKFEKFELLCAQTNSRFRYPSTDPLFRGSVVRLHSEVVHKIESILRDFSAREFFELANWGPGASTLIKSNEASSTIKFQLEVGITRDLYALLRPSSFDSIKDKYASSLNDFSLLGEAYPTWFDQLEKSGFPNFQVGNRVITVPKNALTDRVIAIEPGINIWFQKAIGEMINKRLRRVGVDLRWQNRNQMLAKEASLSGLNATIDFSSASDSISSGVVEALLPLRWFSLLDSCRSRFGKQESGWRSWNKFSSMGNGFTFSLQSLIFFAMAFCCKEEIQRTHGKIHGEAVSVYGDDVIIPVRSLALFSELSDFYGFSLNDSKSFSSGHFRESCGSHYYSGADVKPYYLKDSLSTVQSLYRAANAVRRLASRRNNFLGCDIRLKSAFDFLVSRIPKHLRLRIPETLGDGGLISNFDEATPSRCRHWIEGFFVWSVVDESIAFEVDYVGLLLDRLWSPSVQSRRNFVTTRGRTRLSLKRSLVNRWSDLGPWI